MGETRILKDYQILVAVDNSRLNQNYTVLNLETLGPEVYIKLKPEVYQMCRILRIFDVETKCIVDPYEHNQMNPAWIDISVGLLDLSIGSHVYAIECVNTVTGDTYYQYFGYMIQSDNPDKPYIYMDRDA